MTLKLQGGPMYVIREGLPKRFHFLAFFFAIVGMVGCLPALQANQLIQIFRDLFSRARYPCSRLDPFYYNLGSGIVNVPRCFGVFGGLSRIARTATVLVPFMAILYLAGHSHRAVNEC